MREDIQALLDLREAETKTFNKTQENYNRRMDKFDKEINAIRDNCEHLYGEPETNSYFGFKVSRCTICGESKVEG